MRWRDAIFDVSIARDATGLDLAVTHAARPRPVVVKLALAPGAEAERGIREVRFDGSARVERKRVAVRPGIEIAPAHDPLRVGDPSQRLRVISTTFAGRRYTARLEGLRGRTYTVRVSVPFAIESIAGGEVTRRDGTATDVAVAFPGTGDGWVARELIVNVGPRR
jgi:hypothetical protein